MNFYKLFKTLNSAQSAWQVSLAITFGMISGFLPLFTVINLAILFVAFSINIPFGIFVISSALFGVLALALDSSFAGIGYDILVNPSYTDLFTSMYNYAPTLWSNFNNTIIMGSLIVASIAFLPTFLLFNILINKYRGLFERLFKDSKYFSWLNPFSEKAVAKKPGVFRLFGFIFVSAILALIITFTLLFLDPLLKFVFEFSLNKMSSSEISIKSVKTNFAKGVLVVDGINVKENASTPTNIKIEEIKFDINTSRLLHKKIDIENISFSNIIVRTNVIIEEATSKKESKDTKETEETKEEDSFKLPDFELPSVDSILKSENLKSLEEARKINADIQNIIDKYKNYSNDDVSSKKFSDLEKRIKALKHSISNIKNISEVNGIVKESKAIKNDIKVINSKMKDIKTSYEVDKLLIEEHLQTIKTLPSKEYKQLANKYTFDNDGAMNFVGTYISASLKDNIGIAMKYYKIVKPYLQSEEEEPKEERLKGKTIHFKEKVPYPSFVIEKIVANIDMNSLKASIDINNISNDQKMLNKLITAYVKSRDEKYELATLDIIHNGLENRQISTVDFKLNKFKNSKYNVASGLNLEESLLDVKSKATITDFKSILLNMNTDVLKTNMNYASNGSKINDIVKSILSDVHNFSIDASMNGDINNPSISINSNLDTKISQGLKSEIKKFKKELEVKLKQKFKAELATKINTKDFEKIEKLVSIFDKNKSLENNIKNITSSSLIKDLKKKEEKKLKAKAKKRLEDKLKNKLKSLF